MSDHMSKRPDKAPAKDDRKKQPADTTRNADNRERTTRDRDGGTGPNDYGSQQKKFEAELAVLEKAYRDYDVTKLRDYAKNHKEKFVRDKANYWLGSTPVSDYILITETYRNDLEALKRLRDKPQQSAYNKEIAQNRINILDPSAKTTSGRDNNSNTTQDQQAQDDEDARQKEREDQKKREEQQRDSGAAPDSSSDPNASPAIAMFQESAPNTPSAPTPGAPLNAPDPNIPYRGGVSGGPTRRERYANLHYPSEFFTDKEKFNEVFRYAVRNPYSYAHPFMKKPDMINIVENRRNFLS